MTVLVTGAAGFIGYHVCTALLARGEPVVGVDMISDYYDVTLKEARLAKLTADDNFSFQRIDLADPGVLQDTCNGIGIDRIVHLAAQAGVRHSLTHPFDYQRCNLEGHLRVLEFCRNLEHVVHLVYASSSSVYGGNAKLPFSEADRVDFPVSLYAATKKACELMSHSYSHIYRMPLTGLRFFTVYGPWGRPDMAAWLFVHAILAGETIQVFNHGDMMRDFTYIDDVVAGVLAVLDNPPEVLAGTAPHRIYNIGNNRTEKLMDFIGVIEEALGQKAAIMFKPMQAGDVRETYADIDAIRSACGFTPKTTIEVGIPKFIAWYRDYHRVRGPVP